MDAGKLVIGVVLPEEPEEVTNQLWSRTKVNIQKYCYAIYPYMYADKKYNYTTVN